MATLFEKLLLKDQDEILVLNAPESFEPELARLPVATVHRSLRTARVVRFSLAFVTRQIEVDALVSQLLARAIGDAAIWFSFPRALRRNSSTISIGIRDGVP